MPSKVYIAVIGTGGVGRSFLTMLESYAARNTSPSLVPILISRSSSAAISRDYSGLSFSADLKDKPLAFPDETLSFLKSAPGPAILVDNTSAPHIASSYPTFLKAGISVVTPNKKAFSDSLTLWDDIYNSAANGRGAANAGYVFHEATVGAGLPVLCTLKSLVETGDKIKKIEGVFSGTMSYLFNNFAPLPGTAESKNSPPFSQAVKIAKELGFTEPDPRDDLNGMDVARKLTILARLSGVRVESPTSFPVESLIPKPLESAASADEFLDGLKDFDGEMAKTKEAAEKEGKVVRYVGSLDAVSGKVEVGLKSFEVGSSIAGLKGSDNVISFTTERYSTPLVIQGSGAGSEVTAMGVLADLIRVVVRLK